MYIGYVSGTLKSSSFVSCEANMVMDCPNSGPDSWTYLITCPACHSQYGGGISMEYGTLSVDSSSFVSCSATIDEGEVMGDPYS